jgi:hypothetical protein
MLDPVINFLTDIFSDYHQSHGGQQMNKETIASVVFLSELDAAKAFKMGSTRFKATCRCIGIKKWPYRRLNALKNLYNELKKDDLEHTAMMHEIKNFVMMIKKDFSLVTGPWPSNILNIRSKIYKKRHKQVATDRIIIEAGKADEDIHDVCLDYLQSHDYDLAYDLFSEL